MKRSLLLAMAILAFACTKPNQEEDTTPVVHGGAEPATQTDCDIHGYAQKGQFVKGSQVTAFALGSDLVATGESFPSNISDDLGAFGISGKTKAPYLELRAEGYYFNEITGAISENPLYLEAFVKSADKKANINLLTTAVRPRVKKLIKEGKSFDEALAQAQNELLTAVGFTGNAADFDSMDITGTSEADGMLLAFACMVQSDRSASQVTTFVQEIASDIEDDGLLTPAVFDKYKSKLESVNPFSIIENMANYYAEKKLAVTTVPAFYRYLDAKYNVDFILNPGSVDLMPDYGNTNNNDPFYGYESGQISSHINVLSTINFSVESDLQGVTIEKNNILGPAYRISVNIPANESFEGRYVHIIFKDASGKELARQEFIQSGDAQYIIITGGAQTKSVIDVWEGNENNPFQEGTVVSVNGKECTLQKYEALRGELGVLVHKEDFYTVSYPANSITASSQPSEYGASNVLKAMVTIDSNCDPNPPMQYLGICDMNSAMLSNPPIVRMWPVFSTIMLDLLALDNAQWSYLEVEPLAIDEYLAGTAIYSMNQYYFMYDGISSVSLTFENDKSRTIRINNKEASTYILFNTFPQSLSQGFHASLYNASGEVIAEDTVEAISLRAGCIYRSMMYPVTNQDANPNWLELPAYEEDNLHMALIHDIVGGKYVSATASGIRNWTGFWDRNEHLCHWVAYPLNSTLRGSGSRTDQWGFDPLLPTSEQPNLTNASYGGGWTRGHQIPSADRLNYASNVSTFYCTNMTPQQYDFNSGIWANLEGKVRNYAYQCDTLYVVTGCLVENSTTYSGNNSGFKVKVPTHYYKALLSRTGNNFKAIGFIMPHSADIANEDYWNYRTSIDELETVTGLDFFPNLKKIIGETAADNVEKEIGSW